jgi:ferrochelatase
MKNKKIAVIIYNLGGPNSLSEVKEYLFNLFYDVITLPNPFRWILSKFISILREKKAKGIYNNIGGKSPLLEETIMQANSLQNLLDKSGNIEYKVYVAMQCWKPRFEDIYKDVEFFAPDKIITIPLYPQFSSVTTGKSIEKLEKVFSTYKQKIKHICCYFDDEKFINSHIELIKKTLKENFSKDDNYRILFSAHGLPQILVDKGDSYQFQIETMVKLLVDKIDIKDLDWKITYQSRVGRIKWLEPDTENEIKVAGEEKKDIFIVPISFVSEHVETLVELDIEYKELAHSYEIKFARVPTLRNNRIYIESLGDIIEKNSQENNCGISSQDNLRKCPRKFKLCLCSMDSDSS